MSPGSDEERENTQRISRREFLKIAATITAMASLGSTVAMAAKRLYKGKPKTFQATSGQEWNVAPGVNWKLVPTNCGVCRNHCNLLVAVQDGVIRSVYPNPKTRTTFKEDFYIVHNWGICPKAPAAIFQVYNPYRIKKPLKRTNPKKGLGEDPKWIEIEWEEAFNEIVSKLKKIMETDPRKLIVQYAAGKYLWGDKNFKAFAAAFGTPNTVHRTTICEASRHVADELTWGGHTFLPDLKYTRLLVVAGANPAEAGQWSRWLNKAMADAIDRGMKLIVIDPRLSNMAAKAYQWIPIRPGTDVALWLGVAKVLVENGYVDKEFLINYTDAPYLVGPDGRFLRDDQGRPLVWDTVSNSAKPFTAGVKPALEGSYTINGKTYKTAFQVFLDELKNVDLDKVSEITGVPKDTIIKLALEMGKEARIGSTMVIGGKPYRYRPVAIYTFRGMITHEYGSQHWRAGWIVLMLLGAINAVGGVIIHKPNPNHKNMKPSSAEYPPNRVDLKGSVYFPHASHDIAQQVGYTILDPKAYGLPYVPEAQIIIGANRVFAAPNSQDQVKAYSKTWNVVIDIVLTETAELADIVIPDLTFLESWQWVISPRWNPYVEHVAIRQPVIKPVFNIPYGATDFLIELAKRLGIYEKMIENLNKQWGLKKYPLDPKNPNIKYKDVIEHVWMEKTGQSFDYAIKNGFYAWKVSPEKRYGTLDSVYGGPDKPKMHFYAEQLAETYYIVEEKVKKYGIKNIDLDYYKLGFSPLPKIEHAFQSVRKGKEEYPFYLITYKVMFRRQSGDNALNPLLYEIARNAYTPSDENRLLIHPDTAKKLGINEGDWVVVESPRGKIRIRARLTRGIRPDTVAISYHFGHWARAFPEWAKRGANPNLIMELRSDIIGGEANFQRYKGEGL